jgi:hypothetical protein
MGSREGVFNATNTHYLSSLYVVYEMVSMCKPFAKLTDQDHQEFVCMQGKRPNAKPLLRQCGVLPADVHDHPLLQLLREAWEQYVRLRIDMATVVEGMEEIIADRKQQQEAAAAFEKELAGSVVSATGETVAESSCSDLPLHQPGDHPPHSPSDSSHKNVHVDEDTVSIDPRLPLNIGVPVSRHSMNSVESTSSDHSSQWNDSVSTNDALTEQSLNSIAFDEFLSARHRGAGLGGSGLGLPESSSPLSPPVIHSKARAYSNAYLPESVALATPTLERVVSRNLEEEDDKE